MLCSTKKIAVSALYLGLLIVFVLLCDNSATVTPPSEVAPSPYDSLSKERFQPKTPLLLDNIKFENISIEAGLSHSTVTCIQKQQGLHVVWN